MDYISLNQLHVHDLKQLLRERKLKVSGNKAELINRLLYSSSSVFPQSTVGTSAIIPQPNPKISAISPRSTTIIPQPAAKTPTVFPQPAAKTPTIFPQPATRIPTIFAQGNTTVIPQATIRTSTVIPQPITTTVIPPSAARTPTIIPQPITTVIPYPATRTPTAIAQPGVRTPIVIPQPTKIVIPEIAIRTPIITQPNIITQYTVPIIQGQINTSTLVPPSLELRSNIDPPPLFMSPNPYNCEGFWDGINQGGYQPIRSHKIWKNIEFWLRRAYYIENLIRENKLGRFSQQMGYSQSRIDNSIVGSGEYIDEEYNMCWPEDYVQHYIETHNVPPTERFFNYINERYRSLGN